MFYAHEHKLGMLPVLLKKLFLRRKVINDKLNSNEYSGDVEYAMRRRQKAFKLILNSAYGAMGFPYFRTVCPRSIGRMAILWAGGMSLRRIRLSCPKRRRIPALSERRATTTSSPGCNCRILLSIDGIVDCRS